MKIVELRTENIKRIKAVHIRPSGNVVVIGGENAQGKSSLLDSIVMALGGAKALPSVPIRQGADEGNVFVDLGDLSIELRLAEGRRELVVRDANRAKVSSPQSLLDKLYSRATFDPLAFARDKPDKQISTLKAMVGLDFTKEDAQRSQLYELRTDVGRRLVHATERLTAIPLSVMSAAPAVDIAAMVAEKDRLWERNMRRVSTEARAEQARLDVARLSRELAAAQEDLDAATMDLDGMADYTAELESLSASIAGAEETNRLARAKTDRQTRADECKDLEHEKASLTRAIEDIDQAKAYRMAAAKWPVPGLGFDADGITMEGLPWDQASGAQRVRVSLAIGCALNPELQVLLIKDASLLDKASMAIVREMADERDMQIWLERVGDGDPGAIIIEDGSVREYDDEA